jgi:hypothetical protein
MLKQSDCNSCADRNCQEGTYNRIRFDCKSWKPAQRPLAKLAEVCLENNPQGLHDTLKRCKLTLIKSLS